jgi:hypothetical protein
MEINVNKHIPLLMVLLLISCALGGVSYSTEEEVKDTAERGQSFTGEGGPMDSPWPMKCHDNHHTSRSPYSTADNLGDELWRFKTKWDGTIESSAVIDNNGIIYFGSMGSDRRLYALYPNGTEKWDYQVGLMIWSTPAIAEDGTIYVTSYDFFYIPLILMEHGNGSLMLRMQYRRPQL